MEYYYTVVIITAIIQIITLIVFFVMAANVSTIKKKLINKYTMEQFIERSNEEKYVGNLESAREFLLRAEYQLMKKKDVLVIENNRDRNITVEANIKEVDNKIQKIKALINKVSI